MKFILTCSLSIGCVLMLLFFQSCAKRTTTNLAEEKLAIKKIKFDLANLDENGLSGSVGGKTSVDYEFCLPANALILAEFQKIDPTLKQNKGRGRVGCGGGTWLVMGSTNQKNWRAVLISLANRSEIVEIQQTFWE